MWSSQFKPAEAKVSNPVEATKSFFFVLISQLLQLRYNCNDHIFNPFSGLVIHSFIFAGILGIHTMTAPRVLTRLPVSQRSWLRIKLDWVFQALFSQILKLWRTVMIFYVYLWQCCTLKWILGQNDFKLVWFDFSLFHEYGNQSGTKGTSKLMSVKSFCPEIHFKLQHLSFDKSAF